MISKVVGEYNVYLIRSRDLASSKFRYMAAIQFFTIAIQNRLWLIMNIQQFCETNCPRLNHFTILFELYFYLGLFAILYNVIWQFSVNIQIYLRP